MHLVQIQMHKFYLTNFCLYFKPEGVCLSLLWMEVLDTKFNYSWWLLEGVAL